MVDVINEKKSSDPVVWLSDMLEFCKELQLFCDTLDQEADTESLVQAPEWVRENPGEWRMLNRCTEMEYNFDVPAERCMREIMDLNARACMCYRSIFQHRALGKFRPDRTQLFFEKGMHIAMSVGLQHHTKGMCTIQNAMEYRQKGEGAWQPVPEGTLSGA